MAEKLCEMAGNSGGGQPRVYSYPISVTINQSWGQDKTGTQTITVGEDLTNKKYFVSFTSNTAFAWFCCSTQNVQSNQININFVRPTESAVTGTVVVLVYD